MSEEKYLTALMRTHIEPPSSLRARLKAIPEKVGAPACSAAVSPVRRPSVFRALQARAADLWPVFPTPAGLAGQLVALGLVFMVGVYAGQSELGVGEEGGDPIDLTLMFAPDYGDLFDMEPLGAPEGSEDDTSRISEQTGGYARG